MKKILAALALCLLAGWASAQAAWPNRAVRIVVPFPAGQTTDVIARLLAQQFTESIGQSFFVDNKAVNVDGATALGVTGHVFTDAPSLREFLVSLAQEA